MDDTNVTRKQIKNTSLEGRNALLRREGKKDFYDDIAGNCTKGIGVLVHTGHCTESELRQKLSEQDKADTFSSAIEVAERAVREKVSRQNLSQRQFDALVSFTFNVGAAGASDVLQNVNDGKFQTAANRMQQYNKYTPLDQSGKPLREKDGSKVRKVSAGLTKRRLEESRLLMIDVGAAQQKSVDK